MGRYSQGVCEESAVILRDGDPITVDEVVAALNQADSVAERERALIAALQRISTGKAGEGVEGTEHKAAAMRVCAFNALSADRSPHNAKGKRPAP